MNDYIPKPLNTSLLFKMMNSQAKGANTGSAKPPAAVPEEAPIVNLDYLKEFSGGHKGFEREMIELLLQQIPENIEQLAEAYEAREPEAIRQIAHKIKSSVAMLGSPELIPLLTKIEHQSTPETFSENIKTDIDLVTRILEQCYPELKRILTTDY
jgi:HPt (histidine-containing phosphotransfer) domain-containing protein